MNKEWLILFFSCIVFLISGCDNNIQPLNTEKGVFSIYGYLNLNKDENFIRVKNLNKPLIDDTTQTIDAKVTFRNIDNGNSEILEDSVVEFDGVKTHNFRTTMEIKPNTGYEVTAENSQGEKVTAQTVTPYKSQITVKPTAPVCTTNVDLKMKPIRSKYAIRLEMGFDYDGETFWLEQHQSMIKTGESANLHFTPIQIIQELTSNEDEQGSPPQEDVYCEDLDSNLFHIRYTHYGPGLYGNDISDTLKVPGGAGRLGAFYKDTYNFPIDTRRICPPLC